MLSWRWVQQMWIWRHICSKPRWLWLWGRRLLPLLRPPLLVDRNFFHLIFRWVLGTLRGTTLCKVGWSAAIHGNRVNVPNDGVLLFKFGVVGLIVTAVMCSLIWVSFASSQPLGIRRFSIWSVWIRRCPARILGTVSVTWLERINFELMLRGGISQPALWGPPPLHGSLLQLPWWGLGVLAGPLRVPHRILQGLLHLPSPHGSLLQLPCRVGRVRRFLSLLLRHHNFQALTVAVVRPQRRLLTQRLRWDP